MRASPLEAERVQTAGEGTGLRRLNLHAQLRDALRAEIESGRLLPGAPLPSEKELVRRYGVSRQTVRHAMADLAHARLVETFQGKGTFVCQARDATVPHVPNVRRIGVLFAHLNGWFCMETLAGIERITRGAGYDLSVRTTDDPEDTASAQSVAIEQLREAGAVGVIVEPVTAGENERRYFSDLLRGGFPAVCVDRGVAGSSIPWVTSDNFGGGREVGRHLLERGHRRLAFLPPHEPGLCLTAQRRSGLRAAMAQAGVPPDLLMEATPCRGQLHSVRNAVEKIVRLPLNRRPSALVCGADYIAAEAMFILRTMGLHVPYDMAVTGFDDVPYAAWLQPSLTTVRQDPRRMGEVAASMLLEMVDRGCVELRNEVLPVALQSRGSTDARVPGGEESVTLRSALGLKRSWSAVDAGMDAERDGATDWGDVGRSEGRWCGAGVQVEASLGTRPASVPDRARGAVGRMGMG